MTFIKISCNFSRNSYWVSELTITFSLIVLLSTSEYSSFHWHTVVLQRCQKKSAPSSVFLSLLALSWGDFKLPRYSNQNTARDFPLSWNQLSFCSGVSFWLTHPHTYMTQTLSPKTPCRQKEEQNAFVFTSPNWSFRVHAVHLRLS